MSEYLNAEAGAIKDLLREIRDLLRTDLGSREAIVDALQRVVDRLPERGEDVSEEIREQMTAMGERTKRHVVPGLLDQVREKDAEIARLREEVERLTSDVAGYQGDLGAIVSRMNALGYPNHPEYPNDGEIIRRLGEMVARAEKAEAERDRLRKEVDRLRGVLETRHRLREEVDRLRGVLESRHGGEPLALLHELDEAREEVERLARELDQLRDGCDGCAGAIPEGA